jgi:hypothetical protein
MALPATGGGLWQQSGGQVLLLSHHLGVVASQHGPGPQILQLALMSHLCSHAASDQQTLVLLDAQGGFHWFRPVIFKVERVRND